MKKKFLINIHVPKCGGTTFLKVLQNNFGAKYDSSYGHIWRDFFSADQVAHFIKTDSRFEVFSTHEISLNLPFDDKMIDLSCTVGLRDPVSRCVSHYFFERQRGTSKFQDTLDLSLNDFLQQVLDAEDHWLINYQTKHLCRDTDLTNAEEIVKLAEDKRIFPIVLERFPESMLMLEDVMSDWFSDCSFVPTNMSRHTEKIDSSVESELRARNHQDEVLLKWGNSFLDERKDDRFDARMASLVNRCSRQKKRQTLKKRFRSVLGALRKGH